MAVSHMLDLWRIDPLLHGELCLKMCCILECSAKNRKKAGPLESAKLLDSVVATFLKYDRSKLLKCQQELQRALAFIQQARHREEKYGDAGGGIGGRKGEGELEDPVSDLAVLHVECIFALTRIQVKLASTCPPKGKYFILLYFYSNFSSCLDFIKSAGEKASSLKSKVLERQQRQQQKQQLLSQLSSPEVPIPGLEELRVKCGRSHYLQAMLLMLQATTFPGLSPTDQHKLMEVRKGVTSGCGLLI